MLCAYLNDNRDADANERLNIINDLLHNDVSFGDLRIHKIEDQEPQFDSYTVRDFFNTYNEHYLKNYILYKSDYRESIGYDNIINLLSNFLLHSKTEQEESERYYERHHNFSDMLKTEDNDQVYDAWTDSVFNARDEINHDRQRIIQISKRQNKNLNHPAWASINEVQTKPEDMTESQKELFEIISTLKEHSKNAETKLMKWALNKVSRNIQYALKLEIEPVNASWSTTKKKHEDEYIEVVTSKILDTLDYTNPQSIFGLIISYYDLWSKYQDQVGSPIYTILKEFKSHVDIIQLKNEQHQRIMNDFLDNYHGKTLRHDKDGKKEIAKMLDMDTEKMMRSLKGSISRQISKYFEEHVGN
ncbi:hypothetical protein D3C74_83600 [compost metagenome]